MSFADFLASTATDHSPPPGTSQALAALWHDQRGDWETAHKLAQAADGKDGAWVHAYLHRKEGDEGNAAYWYRLAGRPMAQNPFTDEWQQIARDLLSQKKF